MALSAQTAYI